MKILIFFSDHAKTKPSHIHCVSLPQSVYIIVMSEWVINFKGPFSDGRISVMTSQLIWYCTIIFPDTDNQLQHYIPQSITLVITLRPRRNGCHFADDTFKCIFLNENVRISIKISLKFVPKDPINNIPALVQIMAWRRPGDKPWSAPSHYLNQ